MIPMLKFKKACNGNDVEASGFILMFPLLRVVIRRAFGMKTCHSLSVCLSQKHSIDNFKIMWLNPSLAAVMCRYDNGDKSFV